MEIRTAPPQGLLKTSDEGPVFGHIVCAPAEILFHGGNRAALFVRQNNPGPARTRVTTTRPVGI
ncbi:MAG: hypothetical protein A2Z43_05090 [Syntrophobacterales bacterium RBG_19FT_COMBO_59_10]|nr:MAG: hypothetical protein A2Z43_05090 [Syntrophobacterales bacterium RBG_19FT_COMBO_59_10]